MDSELVTGQAVGSSAGPPHLRPISGTALQCYAHLQRRCSRSVRICSCPLHHCHSANQVASLLHRDRADNRSDSPPDARGQQDSIRRKREATSSQPLDRGLWIKSSCWSGPLTGRFISTTPSINGYYHLPFGMGRCPAAPACCGPAVGHRISSYPHPAMAR